MEHFVAPSTVEPKILVFTIIPWCTQIYIYILQKPSKIDLGQGHDEPVVSCGQTSTWICAQALAFFTHLLQGYLRQKSHIVQFSWWGRFNPWLSGRQTLCPLLFQNSFHFSSVRRYWHVRTGSWITYVQNTPTSPIIFPVIPTDYLLDVIIIMRHWPNAETLMIVSDSCKISFWEWSINKSRH